MSRHKGDFILPCNFEIQYAEPLDARIVAEKKSDLIDLTFWESDDQSTYVYRGLTVGVYDDGVNNGLYIFIGTNENDPLQIQDYNNWLFVGSNTNIGGSVTAKEYDDIKQDQFWANNDLQTGLIVSIYDDGVNTGAYIYIGDDDPINQEYKDDNNWIKIGEIIYIGQINGNIAVGGIAADTDLSSGYTMQEMWDLLLYPELFGTLTPPSVGISTTPSGLMEIGTNINSLVFTTTFNRGSINPQFQSAAGFRSGLPNAYEYNGVGLPTGQIPTQSLSNQQIINNVIIGNTQTWGVRIYFDAGVQPKSNKGNDYNNPYPAGNISTSVTIIGAYPILGNINNLTNMDKHPLQQTNTTVTIKLVADSDDNLQKKKFAIPVSWNNPSKIQELNTVSNIYEDISISENFDITQIGYYINSNETNVMYNVYTYKKAKADDKTYKILF